MTEEALQLSRAAAESEKAPPGLLAQVADRLRLGVQHLLLDDPVAVLLRVQRRRVGWQPVEVVGGRVSGHEGLHRVRPMRMESVPGDDHRTADLPPEIPQRADDLRAMDRPGEMSGVEARGTGQRRDQGDDTRDLPPLAHPPQDGRVPPRGPGRADAGPKRVTRLVHEGNGTPCAASPLFRRGQSRWSHASTKASSRSLARGIGRWALHPRARNAGPRARKWYRTPNARSTTWAIRRSVQRSVSNPAAWAPRRRSRKSWCHWGAVNREGRPGGWRWRKPRTPARSRRCRQRVTDARLTPSSRAIAAWDSFRARSNRPAARRRSSSWTRVSRVGCHTMTPPRRIQAYHYVTQLT